jgi:hypothetical protein
MRGWHPMCATLPHAPHPTARARSDTLSSTDHSASRAQALELPGYGVGKSTWKENGKTVRGVIIDVEELAKHFGQAEDGGDDGGGDEGEDGPPMYLEELEKFEAHLKTNPDTRAAFATAGSPEAVAHPMSPMGDGAMNDEMEAAPTAADASGLRPRTPIPEVDDDDLESVPRRNPKAACGQPRDELRLQADAPPQVDLALDGSEDGASEEADTAPRRDFVVLVRGRGPPAEALLALDGETSKYTFVGGPEELNAADHVNRSLNEAAAYAAFRAVGLSTVTQGRIAAGENRAEYDDPPFHCYVVLHVLEGADDVNLDEKKPDTLTWVPIKELREPLWRKKHMTAEMAKIAANMYNGLRSVLREPAKAWEEPAASEEDDFEDNREEADMSVAGSEDDPSDGESLGEEESEEDEESEEESGDESFITSDDENSGENASEEEGSDSDEGDGADGDEDGNEDEGASTSGSGEDSEKDDQRVDSDGDTDHEELQAIAEQMKPTARKRGRDE